MGLRFHSGGTGRASVAAREWGKPLTACVALNSTEEAFLASNRRLGPPLTYRNLGELEANRNVRRRRPTVPYVWRRFKRFESGV